MRALTTGSSRPRRMVCCLALLLGLLGSLGPSQVVRAATLTVTTTTDELNADGDCSLREAVRAANLDSAVDACPAGSGADTITLPAGTYMVSLDPYPDENAAASDDLDLLGDVSIVGADARTTIIDGGQRNRAFDIQSGANASISGVTIRNSRSFDGGAIQNQATLIVTNSWIRNNRAYTTGGGIANNGTLTLNGTTVSANTISSGDSKGGGIINTGTLTLNNSTVSGNLADGDEGPSSEGGGIWSNGTLRLNNSTVTKNVSATYFRGGGVGGSGGGIFGSFTAYYSIIADNSARDEPSDCAGVMFSQSPNLLRTRTGCTISASGWPSNGDPRLAPLRDNGGPTPTHALMPGSAAIDGNIYSTSGCLATDQRGVARPLDGNDDRIAGCDMGAFERQDSLIVNGGFESDTNADGTPDAWSSNSRVTRFLPQQGFRGYALQHQASDNGSYTIFSDPVVSIRVGEVYRFTGFVNIPATNDAFSFEVQVRWRDAGGNVLSTVSMQTYTAATSGWTSFTGTSVAPPNATQATIRQVVGSLNATIYVDELKLRPVDNLLSTGGFEAIYYGVPRLDGWSSNSYTTQSNAVVHTGSYALRHQAIDNASYTIFSDPILPITAGTAYSVAGFVNIPATSDAFSFEVQVRWRDANGNVLSTVPVQSYTAATSGWTSFTGTSVAPPNATQATIRQVVGSLNATIYVDDIVLGP